MDRITGLITDARLVEDTEHGESRSMIVEITADRTYVPYGSINVTNFATGSNEHEWAIPDDGTEKTIVQSVISLTDDLSTFPNPNR